MPDQNQRTRIYTDVWLRPKGKEDGDPVIQYELEFYEQNRSRRLLRIASLDEPMLPFFQAIEGFVDEIAKVLELPTFYQTGMRVYRIKIDRDPEKGTLVTIRSKKQLEEHHQDEVDLPHPPILYHPDDPLAICLESLYKAADAYVDGQRVQLDFFRPTVLPN